MKDLEVEETKEEAKRYKVLEFLKRVEDDVVNLSYLRVTLEKAEKENVDGEKILELREKVSRTEKLLDLMANLSQVLHGKT
jgi:hypothetical protein